MPDLSVETSLPKVNWENVHYCRFIRSVLIIQVQNQERSMRLLTHVYGNSMAKIAYAQILHLHVSLSIVQSCVTVGH